jgi:hypothetical protein
MVKDSLYAEAESSVSLCLQSSFVLEIRSGASSRSVSGTGDCRCCGDAAGARACAVAEEGRQCCLECQTNTGPGADRKQ